MLPENKIKELISVAGVNAICANAGYSVTCPECDYGFDGYIEDVSWDDVNKYTFSGLKLDFQLKATSNYKIEDGYIIYRLRNKNYNMLINRTYPSRILVLFLLPQDRSLWLNICNDSLTIKDCAYYIDLADTGLPKQNITSSTEIRIPISQIFNEETLHKLMHKERTTHELISKMLKEEANK